MQDWHGLTWVITPPSTTCNFMDLTISIINDKITTTIYEKKQNLYLYIPPHSAHPPGIINGLIYGHILCLHCLCSHKQDLQKKTKDLFNCLTQRGHSASKLLPVFHRAHRRATSLILQNRTDIPDTPKPSPTKTFLHLPYHPQDPPRSTIQHIWNSTIINPPHQTPLRHIKNLQGHTPNITRLTIAYSRPPNLGNQLSVRNIEGRGIPVSSFITKT